LVVTKVETLAALKVAKMAGKLVCPRGPQSVATTAGSMAAQMVVRRASMMAAMMAAMMVTMTADLKAALLVAVTAV
jgi:hypothetical protein